MHFSRRLRVVDHLVQAQHHSLVYQHGGQMPGSLRYCLHWMEASSYCQGWYQTCYDYDLEGLYLRFRTPEAVGPLSGGMLYVSSPHRHQAPPCWFPTHREELVACWTLRWLQPSRVGHLEAHQAWNTRSSRRLINAAVTGFSDVNVKGSERGGSWRRVTSISASATEMTREKAIRG
jgi:hypothetical protein